MWLVSFAIIVSEICWFFFFFCVFLVGFLDLLIFLLGLQHFWDFLDIEYGLVC